jgi:GNAT superfamily N-acetyltransferase
MSESSSGAVRDGQSLETISFREYCSEDLERCVEITASGWPELTGSMHSATVDWYLGSATWRDVACVSGHAVGVLFGKVNRDLTGLLRLRRRLIHVKVYLKLLFGLYGKLPHRLTNIRYCISGDRRIEVNSPAVDGEVVFFAVEAAHRRKGIGKSLMDRFIEQAKERDAERISVYTTDPGSDWEFYDRYGFKKHGSFRDDFMSFARKEDVAAMIYVLDIE